MKSRSILLLLALITATRLEAAPSTCGLTIITHGYQQDNGFPAWVTEMAEANNVRTGAALPIYRVRYDKMSRSLDDDVIRLEGEGTSIDITNRGGAILLLDWGAASNEPVLHSTETVANSFFTNLFSQSHKGHYLAEAPIHLIGHSRGASLNTQSAFKLAQSGVLIDQFTTMMAFSDEC